ncbi:hypothetical protein FB45DRAFT_1142768 [Roridomyces roridus]|uniref:NAD(P)-binding protein n=1 Tax=Roridomyces roridus TaxID=1738132 RepID=A0AAD7BZV3_9AGAR|nr:hypothetical protein FB45DRAFT_1142768 [Roridomyces roridus]
MSAKTQFFLAGATGYIGGTPTPLASNLPCLSATPKRRKNSTSFLASQPSWLASEADIVVGVADSDDLMAAEATLDGLKQRYATTGVPPIFIHTSGAALFIDDAKGTYAASPIYDDSDADQMAALPPNRMHRNVDLAILAGDAAGYTKTYLVIPAMVYGMATGQFVDKGLQNSHSTPVPMLVKPSFYRRRAGMVGEGKNVWPNVEIHDLAELYIALYDSITSNPSTGHGVNGYYFGANGEHSFYDLTKAVGEALVVLGKSDDPEPTTYSQAELDKYFGGSEIFGTNCHCIPTHSLAIGWKPTKGTKDLLASVKPEVEALIAKWK